MRKTLLVAGLVGMPIMVSNKVLTPKAVYRPSQDDPRLRALQEFFADRDCPLSHSAADFIAAADQNQLDWRLLPSISMIESSGGKDCRNNNVFGWASGREEFTSVQAGIRFVAARLANSKLYKDKDLDAKLLVYNPQPEYALRVKAVMRKLGTADQSPRAAD